MSDQDILKKMLNDAPDQVAALETNIASIDSTISSLTDQADALSSLILDVDATALMLYLDSTKVNEVGGVTVEYGSEYNETNITDWQVVDSTGNPIYEYEGVGWDSDVYIVQLVTDWAFIYDYLTRSLTSGATYGIYPQISTLQNAKTLLETNRDKIYNSIDVLERYT